MSAPTAARGRRGAARGVIVVAVALVLVVVLAGVGLAAWAT